MRPLSSPEGHKISGGNNRLRATSNAAMKGDIAGRYSITTDPSQISPRSEQPPIEWRTKINRHSDPEHFIPPHIEQPRVSREFLERRNIEQDRQAVFNREYEIEAMRQNQSRQENLMPKTDEPPAPALSPQERSHPTYAFLSNKSSASQKDNTKPADKSTNVPKGPLGPEQLRRIRDDRLGTATQQRSAPAEARPTFIEALENKRRSDSPRYNPGFIAMERSDSFDRAMQNVKDGENGHRNSLGLALEHSRRTGRSPLPQAVQGAANQSDGPSRDPSVKNEFKKLFAGIGSGVSSSGLAGSGASTPFPPSPKQGEHRLELDIPASRNASRMGNKRQRRPNDEKDREGSSKAEGAKRMRHHQYAFPSLKPVELVDGLLTTRSHHHHRHLDDQNATPVRVIGDPVATNNHHHHHRDGTIHYHSHGHTHPKPIATNTATVSNSKKAPPSAVPTPTLPSLIINNSPVLSTISSHPRTHLGTIVYGAPPSKSTPSFPHLAATTPSTHNRTIHILIPRSELSRQARQEICSRRHLWGAGVYTTDSDPLAAAVHDGWVEGWWGSEWVSSIIYSSSPTFPSAAAEGKGADTIAKGKGKAPLPEDARTPVTPPDGKDARLTLLILPGLTEYASVIKNGGKRRECAGSKEGGGSFMITGVEWVDVPTLQGGARARRERVGRLVGGVGVGGRGREMGAGGGVREMGAAGRCAVSNGIKLGYAARGVVA